MPETQLSRREVLIGVVGVLAVGGILLMRRASTVESLAPAVAATIPADVLPVAGAGAGGDGIGLGTSSGAVLGLADATSQLAAQGATAASDAGAGALGNQASSTPGTGNQVPTGSGSSTAGPGLPLALTDPQVAVSAAIAAEYAGTPYPVPTVAGGPYPSTDAWQTGPVGSPSDLLAAMKAAAAAGVGQVQLPSGEVWAANPATIATVERNIALDPQPAPISPPPTPAPAPAPTAPKPVAAATPAPTAAQLAAIKARAIAAGHNPTPQQILDTYYRWN